MTRTPAIFFGHGSPMNALGGPYAEAWRALDLRKPRALLMVSAHWETEGVAATAMETPRTIHDFYGFPEQLFEMRYAAPGAPALAARVAELLAPDVVMQDQSWGLDHGTWSVLAHAFPGADVPVVQLSLDVRRSAQEHYALAQKLAPLRDEGVLIAGSGDVVHNLRVMNRASGAPAFDWAQRWHDHVKRMIAANDIGPLITPSGQDAALSIPTAEHYLPLLYVLAQRGAEDRVSFFTDSIDLGSVSMLGVRLDAA